ncbi:UNVERIFIED_CONTAM: hypothetical protein FKN15_013795 [Acipenser sinensis]
MKNKEPFSCRRVLVVYNIGLTLLSFYMFYELVTGAWEGGYNFFCQDTHSGGEADMKIVRVLWWYYFSKLIEFMDTFFFILRKNNHQITFLHVYHHATMPNIWWFVMNWVPCGHSYFGANLNSFIHVLMYSYYGLSAIPAVRPYLWWKKYITQGQLIQFVLTMFQTTCAVFRPCGFPMGWLYFQICYLISLIALFSNFYIQGNKYSLQFQCIDVAPHPGWGPPSLDSPGVPDCTPAQHGGICHNNLPVEHCYQKGVAMEEGEHPLARLLDLLLDQYLHSGEQGRYLAG